MADENLEGYLYKLRFPNGKEYIGITKRTVGVRFAQHVNFARSSAKPCAVHRAINKYGADAVEVETLLVADMKYLNVIEVAAIEAFGTKAPSGYNLTIGGEGTRGMDAETRAKMGIANKGKKASAETKLRMSDARKAMPPPSIETRAKIGARFKGKTLSDEHKEKIGAAQRGVAKSESHLAAIRAVHCGKIIGEAQRAAISTVHKGKVISADHRARISAYWANRRAQSIDAK